MPGIMQHSLGICVATKLTLKMPQGLSLTRSLVSPLFLATPSLSRWAESLVHPDIEKGGPLCTHPALLFAFAWGRVAASSGCSPRHQAVCHLPCANLRASMPIHSPHPGQRGSDVRAEKTKIGRRRRGGLVPRSGPGIGDLELETSLYCSCLA